MKLTTRNYTSSMPVFWVFFFSAFLISFIQWEFSRLTGSSLVFGQSLLQLSLCILLLFNWMKPNKNGQLVAQFFTSFIILGLCGLLINESYIHWQENKIILTNDAFPVVTIGIIGVLFLSRIIFAFVRNDFPGQESKTGRNLIFLLSVFIVLSLIVVHLTGWVWLDALVAAVIGGFLGLTAIFFLLDSYWSIMDIKEGT